MATQFTLPRQVKINVAGRPYAGAQAFFYETGTDTPQTVYQDTNLTTPHAQPIAADDDGYFPVIWLDPDADFDYRYVITSSTGVPLDDISDVPRKPFTSSDIATTLDSLRQTSFEAANNIVPVNPAYEPGDVRRYVAGAAEQSRSWYCYGHPATFVDSTHFTVPGNQTGIYRQGQRLLIRSSVGGLTNLRTLVSSFSAGVTTVTIIIDAGGSLPNPISAVSVQVGVDTNGPNTVAYNLNSAAGAFFVANRNDGTSAVGRLAAHMLDPVTGLSTAGIVMVAVGPNYVGSYLLGGYASGSRAVLYSQVTSAMEIGTSDTARILIPADYTGIRFQNDLIIEPGTSARTRCVVEMRGTDDNRLQFTDVTGTIERGFLYSSGTELTIGSNSSIDVSIVTNGSRALTFRDGNTTGASTPTLSANKPGANAGVIEWVAVKTSGGTVGWMPIFGN